MDNRSVEYCPASAKIKYATPNLAWAAARLMGKRKRNVKLTGHTYFCHHCGGYHFSGSTLEEFRAKRDYSDRKRFPR